MPDLTFIVAVIVFLFGLCLGSFLNVCIYRLPLGQSVVSPRSACPNCKAPISAWDNIPVLSWLLLRARCRHCGVHISARYAVVELLAALLFVAMFLTFGWSLATLKFCVFGFLILGLIFTDAETHLLPDKLTLPGIALGLLFSFFVPVDTLAARVFPFIAELPVSSDISARLFWFSDALLGAALGASFIYGAGVIYLRARGREGMGFGDVKLMAMVGAFLGVKATVLVIFSASLAGSLFGVGTMLIVWLKRTRRRMQVAKEPANVARKRAWESAVLVYRNFQVPFGVFLGSMALVAVFFGERVIQWYLGLYQ
ncbi:MAG: prepilin peptidase [Candidatus Koribacter versatilis]|uniref:Prepilin peptidase n=1 Tax=Candidatus Korobacter versatilis TaxID=658062 RepID=A0A932EPT9_9BACT|nr:prepilin peptidase [Candidatus Koribacter versatilis]